MRWVFVGSGVAALAAGAWYFGQAKSTAVNPPSTAPMERVVAQASAPTPPSATKDIAPLKMIEVIDLTRGYEPAPEEAPVAPAGVRIEQLITLPSAAERMPLARGTTWDVLTITPREVLVEHLTIPPRDVTPKVIEIPDDPLGLLLPGKR